MRRAHVEPADLPVLPEREDQLRMPLALRAQPAPLANAGAVRPGERTPCDGMLRREFDERLGQRSFARVLSHGAMVHHILQTHSQGEKRKKTMAMTVAACEWKCRLASRRKAGRGGWGRCREEGSPRRSPGAAPQAIGHPYR